MLTTHLRDSNKNISRQIRFSKLTAVFRLNTPTTFTGTLDPTSELFFDRITPGWGIIGRDDQVAFGGDLTKIHRKNDRGIPEWELTGVGDLQVVADRLTYPNPQKSENEQDVSHYKYTGVASQAVHALLEANLGAHALPPRRALGAQIRSIEGGSQVSVETRLKNLLTECQTICSTGGVVLEAYPQPKGYLIVVRPPTVRTKSVVFTQQGGEVLGWELTNNAPTATTVVVGGQGEGASRTLETRTRPNDWGRRIEVFKDRRDTDEAADLEKAASEELDKGQATQTLKLEFRETPRLQFGRNFQLGDTVTAILATGLRAELPVTQAKVEWDGYQNRTVSLTLGPEEESLQDARLRNLYRDISHITTI